MGTQPSKPIDELGADGRPHINQQHINYVAAVCTRLAQSGVGKIAGKDELLSEAMVVLWDLALKWDPAKGVPFGAYLSINTRRRLLDWLRLEYGRRLEDGRPGRHGFHPKMVATLGQVSLDAPTPEGTARDWRDPRPAVEEIVAARDDLARVLTYVNTVCTERQRDSLLWPYTGTTQATVAAKWGMSVASIYSHAVQARKHLRKMPGMGDRAA